MVNDRDPRNDLGAWLGEKLRTAREAAGYTSQDALARALGFDRTTINKAETGASPPTLDVASRITARLPELCNGLYADLAALARRANGNGSIPDWFADWVEIEAKASVLRWWTPLLIPGLLQTEEYARAVLSTWRRSSGEEVEAKVAARLDRQAILAHIDYRVLIDESVLRRRIGGPDVMAGQLDHLAAVAARPNITIQVVPETAGAYAGLSGVFGIADIPGEADAAYLETGVLGITVREPTLVDSAARMFDDMRDEALPRSRSLELIAEVERP